MKTLKILNTAAIGIPLALFLLSFLEFDLKIVAMLSTVFTGFMQILIGFYYWYLFPKGIKIKVYFAFVVGYFAFLTFSHIYNLTNYDDTIFVVLWLVPLILCVFLSLMIYSHKNNQL